VSEQSVVHGNCSAECRVQTNQKRLNVQYNKKLGLVTIKIILIVNFSKNND